MDDVELSFDKKALDFIVDKALEYKLGARGLRSICEAIMLDAMYEIPTKVEKEKIVIDLKYAQKRFEKSSLRKLKVA